jgi:hypothetical protein
MYRNMPGVLWTHECRAYREQRKQACEWYAYPIRGRTLRIPHNKTAVPEADRVFQYGTSVLSKRVTGFNMSGKKYIVNAESHSFSFLNCGF